LVSILPLQIFCHRVMSSVVDRARLVAGGSLLACNERAAASSLRRALQAMSGSARVPCPHATHANRQPGIPKTIAVPPQKVPRRRATRAGRAALLKHGAFEFKR